MNVYILPWKDPPFLLGKSTISTGPFSIAMLVHRRVIMGIAMTSMNIDTFLMGRRSSLGMPKKGGWPWPIFSWDQR